MSFHTEVSQNALPNRLTFKGDAKIRHLSNPKERQTHDLDTT
jgi:hypothetical protein